jgi:hypothetical protein
MTPLMAAFVSAYFAHDRKVSTAAKSLGKPKSLGFKLMRDERVKAAIALNGVLPAGAVSAKGDDLGRQAKIKATNASRREAQAHRRQRAVEQATAAAASYAEPVPPLPSEAIAYDVTTIRNRLAIIAEAKTTDLFKQVKRSGKMRSVPKDISEIDQATAYAVQRIKITSAGSIEISLYSKIDALRLLGQSIGAFAGEGEGETPVGGAMTEEALTLEERLKTYDNVVPGKFGPKVVKRD